MLRPCFVIVVASLMFAACGQAPLGQNASTASATEPAEPALSAPAPGTEDAAAADAGRASTRTPASAPTPDPRPSPAPTPAAAAPLYREVVVPAGTRLSATLTNAVASDDSQVEDRVTATLSRSVTIDGTDVWPVGTVVSGRVTSARESGRVKGRASVAFRFESARAGDAEYAIQTEPISRLAPATKADDVTKIGIGAGAGALIGGILGGGDGAAKGAAIGAGAGTGVVLATKGEEVRLGPGTAVTIRLTSPVTVRVPVR